MRRLLGVAAVVICAACGDQSTADPCTIRVNVIETPNIPVNAKRIIEADVTVRAGTCAASEKELSWRSTRPDIAEITATSNTGATVTGRRAGSSTITAWLIRRPTVRDSISVNVVAAADTTS